MNYSDIIHFWYNQIPPRSWFIKAPAFDAVHKRTFGHIHQRADLGLAPMHKCFIDMPLTHSESALIHQQAAMLINQLGLEDNYTYELKHQAVINRFGRYPHRNGILKRPSTPKEVVYLSEPGSGF